MMKVKEREVINVFSRRQELQSLLVSCDADRFEEGYVPCHGPSTFHPFEQQCNACSDFMICDTRIAQMEEELVNMYRRRSLLKEKINRSHDNLLRKIPPEVIAQIFSFFVQGSGIDAPQLPFELKKIFPRRSLLMTLARVCKAWHNLVYGTPRLWANISVIVNPEMCNDSQVQFFRTWLGRSGEAPLFVNLYFDQRHGQQFPVPNPLLEMVIGCSYRWYHLSMYVWNTGLCEAVFEDQRLHNLAQLKSLQVQLFGNSVGPNLKNFLQQTSRLRHFEISRLLSLSDIDIKWSALTHLTIRAMPWDIFHQILHSAPSLIQCEIGMAYAHDDLPRTDQLSSTTLVHSHLQRLRIEQLPAPPFQKIYLDNLVLPSLTDFTYRAHTYFGSDMRALKTMVVESRCAITRLSLTVPGVPERSAHEMMEMLDALPALTHLTFEVSLFPPRTAPQSVEDELIHRLAADNRGQFLPLLKSLELKSFVLYDSVFIDIANFCDSKGGRSGDMAIAHQRPLHRAQIKFVRENPRNLLELAYKNEQNLRRLVGIYNSGFTLKLLAREGDDILKSFLS